MRLASVALLALLVAACDGSIVVTPSSPDTPPASASGAPSPSTGGFGPIEHATGSTDVLLRFEEGGGFAPAAFLATQAPIFTLYGDGTVIFRNPNLEPLPAVGSVPLSRPFRIARLSEEQIQAVLEDALGQGGLGAARTDYPDNQIADAQTATFTINAGGINKQVSVYALGIDVGSSPDAPARAAFAKLADRLKDFDNGGTFATNEYVPDRYRGSLLEGFTDAPDARAWPWTSFGPADFVANADPSGFELPARVLSATDVEVLEIAPYTGGFQGLALISPDGSLAYTFSLRPLLPDEAK